MKLILFIIVIFFPVLSYAEEIFPKGCVPIVIQGELVELTTKKPVIVMIHNLSDADLWITHPIKHPSASAGWNSKLQTGQWSALALSRHTFTLNCIESRPGHEQQIACADVLAACQWPDTTMAKDTSNTFWAGEDMTLSPLIAYLERQGFGLSNAKSDE